METKTMAAEKKMSNSLRGKLRQTDTRHLHFPRSNILAFTFFFRKYFFHNFLLFSSTANCRATHTHTEGGNGRYARKFTSVQRQLCLCQKCRAKKHITNQKLLRQHRHRKRICHDLNILFCEHNEHEKNRSLVSAECFDRKRRQNQLKLFSLSFLCVAENLEK